MSTRSRVASGNLQFCSQDLVVVANAIESIANAGTATDNDKPSPPYAISNEVSEDARFFVVESTELLWRTGSKTSRHRFQKGVVSS